jgi:cell division protein FtsQ
MRKETARKVVLALVLVAVIAVAAGGTMLGWRWKSSVTLRRIEVLGAHHADSAAVLHLARVDTGMALFDVDPVLVADRVQRHPWIQQAAVERVPTGLLRIRVEERTPVALALSERGTPEVYLDSTGIKMPVTEDAAYDVPLVRGLRETEEEGSTVQNPSVLALLKSLGQLNPEVNALISDFEVERSGDVWMHTASLDARGSIPVRLGKSDYEEKFRRLHAFWHQAALPQPQKTFSWIDLRFDGQIVTQEADSSKLPAFSHQLSAAEN